MSEVSFDVTSTELRLIRKIIDRAQVTGAEGRTSLCMDLSACHANGNPLDFKKLLEADNFNFLHDVYGIVKNMDRSTGKLRNCFVPRSSK